LTICSASASAKRLDAPSSAISLRSGYDVACLEADAYRRLPSSTPATPISALVLPIARSLFLRSAKTRHLFSFDERHFRAVTPLQGGSFSLLPADF